MNRNELSAFLIQAGIGSRREHALASLLALKGLRVSEARAVQLYVDGRTRGPIFVGAHGQRMDRHAADRTVKRRHLRRRRLHRRRQPMTAGPTTPSARSNMRHKMPSGPPGQSAGSSATVELLSVWHDPLMDRDRSGSHEVCLRRVQAADLRWLAEVACDPNLTGVHNWGGEERDCDVVQSELEAEFAGNGLAGTESGTLVVCLEDGTRIGDVSWRTEQWGPSARSRCPAIGINLLPSYRGRGYGTAAQRLLVDYLFRQDPSLHRVQSDTAADNPAERRALAKVGMVEEGIVRAAEFRDGEFHDHILFSLLRVDWERRL